jgi:DNA-binding transcriptional LysR family regulator
MTTIESTLPNLLAFSRTYESGSFTRAAKALHVTPAAVSRSVARLETALGAVLFRRTTRALKPTPAGTAYYAKCAAALALLAEGERDLVEGARRDGGTVRLSVGTTYGLHLLLPRLVGFAERHPKIELEVQMSNQNVDFVAEGFDLAIRMGTSHDAGLVARKLGDLRLGLFASPAYLERRGRPRALADLSEHETIAFVMPRTGRVLPWIFAAPTTELVPRARYRCSDDPNACIALARAGEGIVQTYDFMVAGELARKELVPVLAAHAGRTRRFSLLYPSGVAQPRAVRTVIDEVVRLAPG